VFALRKDDIVKDFNNRLLKEIAHLRSLQKLKIKSERITHCLELLRFIRNSELNLTFEEGVKQEDDWITNNKGCECSCT